MTRLGEGVLLGAMAAVIAPRRENGHTIDISLALDILDFVNDRGVKGVAVLGATGEFIHYDVEDLRQDVETLERLRNKFGK